jgi:hypothetical protein
VLLFTIGSSQHCLPFPFGSQDIGAFDDEERLTRLGRHLAALPLPPKVGKMLLFAIMFGVLDPLLTGAPRSSHIFPQTSLLEARNWA